MKKRLFLIPFFALFILFHACKKEKSFEGSSNPSTGSLKSDVTGDCLPKTVAGAYEKGKALNDTFNYIEVQIDVSKAGGYRVYSDTINGIWFNTTGAFTTTGLQTVKLKGTGTPIADGITNFTIFYDTTFCVVPVTVLATGAGGPAVFTLSSTAGACMSATVAGDYVVGMAVTAANTVTLKVDVTKIGTYTVTTTISNGMTFTGTGTLADLGQQTIVLTASGTPVTVGAAVIPVSVSPTSSCSFTVNVVVTPTVSDYFPRTVNSNWSYETDNVASDSLLRTVVTATKAVGATTYNIFAESQDITFGFDSSGYYARSGANYSEFVDMGGYFGFDNPIWAQNIFLIDNVALNGVWYSSGYTGTYASIPGMSFTWRLKYIVTKKDASVVVKGITYPTVIEVQEKPELMNPVTMAWEDYSASIGYYVSQYAKNVGLISIASVNPATPANDTKTELRRSAVAP